MRTSLTFLGFVMVVAAVTLSSPASGQKREEPHRNQNNGVANPLANGVFTVVSVEPYGRTVEMQGPTGTVKVHVGEGIYDISKLKPGEQVQVNFLVPDGLSTKLSAASIWPVKAPK